MQPFLSRHATLLRQKGKEHCVTRQKMLRGRLPYEPHVVMLFLMFFAGTILGIFWDYFHNLVTANERIVSVPTTVVSIVQTNTNPTLRKHTLTLTLTLRTKKHIFSWHHSRWAYLALRLNPISNFTKASRCQSSLKRTLNRAIESVPINRASVLRGSCY